MINKIILSLVIFFVLYILIIFNMPNVADMIAKLAGIEGFNKTVLSLKNTFDDKSTQIPTKGEFLSGAIDLKNNVIDGVNSTKETIDIVRENAGKVEDTYNQAKDGYDKVKGFIDTNSGKLDEAKKTLQTISDISKTLTNTGETN